MKKKFIVEAVVGFVLWTAILTPYVLLVTLMTLSQYLSWLLMQAIIVPPVAIVVVRVTNRFTKRLE
jgi:membrane protein DedA with SNARE-associated domain